ncbi:FAD-dependent oxidoreductase [Primorskyibacter sp. 2E233]|uniref:FAD-dependent oxidoreductase n=1 Tax=Primorskyibacter sp. 2E233 TaxID=3413431 RepID=UPI003BF39B74
MRVTLKIAVAGAGIGGLAVATGLAQAGHRVQVFDQFDAPAPVGSGLVIQPVGLEVLTHLGAGKAALAQGNQVHRMLGREADSGRRVLDVSYRTGKLARFGLAIHRAALFDALLETAIRSGVDICPGRRVTSALDGHVQFDGGSAGPFDMIIDACGAGSPLSPLKARDLDYGALWATVDWPAGSDLPRDELRQVYRKADRMLGVLPIGTVPGQKGLKAAIFWSLPRGGYVDWLAKGLEAWRAEAFGLWPAYGSFARQITDTAQMTMARYSHGTLVKPYGQGVIHIGDAAHRASPQLGQGANMALLDAWALVRAIKVAQGDADLAALYYARARRWHVWGYQTMSWLFTPQYQSDSRLLPVIRDRALFPLSQVPPVPRALSRLVCGDLLPPVGSLA